jgi:tetratricopeptide (TPR) repeat protein
MSLGFIRPESPADRTRAYAQSELVLEYIIERFGADAPGRLLGVFGGSVTEREAWPDILGISVEDFDRDYGAWAEDRFAEVGLRPARSVGDIAIDDAIQDAGGADAVRDRLAALASGFSTSSWSSGGAVEWEPLEMPSLTEENLERWLSANPGHPDLLEIVARNAVERSGGVPDESHIDLLESYIASRPIDPWPHLMLVRVYRESGRDVDAASHLAWLDAREVNSPLYAAALARTWAGEGDWDDALSVAVRATRLEPFDPEHREVAAEVALRLGEYGVAREQIVALIAIEPERDVHRRRLEAVDALLAGG